MTSAGSRHLIAATFGTHMNGDMTVVGVVDKRWHRGATGSEVEPLYHRTVLLHYLLIAQLPRSRVVLPNLSFSTRFPPSHEAQNTM